MAKVKEMEQKFEKNLGTLKADIDELKRLYDEMQNDLKDKAKAGCKDNDEWVDAPAVAISMQGILNGAKSIVKRCMAMRKQWEYM